MKIISKIWIGLFCGLMAILAGGCETLGPPGARNVISPEFDSERVNPIAVLVVDETAYHWRDARVRGGVYRQIEDEFIQHLMTKGYTLAARSDIQDILMEAEFQRDSGVTADDAVEIGKILNVPTVLIAAITESYVTSDLRTFTVKNLVDGSEQQERRRVYQGHAAIGARLIDVETGQVVWISTYSDRTNLPGPDQVGQAIQPVAAVIARSFPGRYEGSATAGQ